MILAGADCAFETHAAARMTTRAESEAERMARVPGIEFIDGGDGRSARVAGSGVDVFEVARTFIEVRGEMARVGRVYDWLTPKQIDAALAYWRAYPEEIDHRIALDERCLSEL